MISLTFPLTPIAKGRPRFSRNGHAYTPAKTRAFESEMRLLAMQQMEGIPRLTGPLSVYAVFILVKPKSSKRKYPTVKPDLDNFLKCFDSLNGIVWNDDSQIIEIKANKIYDEITGTGPRITLLIQEFT